MGAGYVGILSIDIHLPHADSLKAKRRELSSLKADLIRRFGAAVAEVDFHDRRQRAQLTATLVDRRASDLDQRLAAIERFVTAHQEQARFAIRVVVKPEEFA